MEYGSRLLIDLKHQYGDIFQVETDKTIILFRALTFEEFDNLAIEENYTSSIDAEESIVKTALLYPEFENLDELSAGLISSVAEQIIDESCFFDVKKSIAVLDEKRENASELRSLMKAFVISAMPSYKLEELNKQTFIELAEKVAIAEQIIDMRFQTSRGVLAEEGTAPKLLLFDPEAEEDATTRKAQMHNLTRKDGSAIAGDPVAARLQEALG